MTNLITFFQFTCTFKVFQQELTDPGIACGALLTCLPWLTGLGPLPLVVLLMVSKKHLHAKLKIGSLVAFTVL